MEYQQFGGARRRRSGSSVKDALLLLTRVPVGEGAAAISRAQGVSACSPRSITHTPLLIVAAASLFAALPAASSSSFALFPATEPQSLPPPKVTANAETSTEDAQTLGSTAVAGDEFLRLACTGLAAPMLGTAPSFLIPLELYAGPYVTSPHAKAPGSGNSKIRRAIWGGDDHDDRPFGDGGDGGARPGDPTVWGGVK